MVITRASVHNAEAVRSPATRAGRTRPATAARSASAGGLRARLALTALAVLPGCTDATGLNLGGNGEDDGIDNPLCSLLSENVIAATQAELDVLRGCEQLPGDLLVRVPSNNPESLSFAPLASLRVVRGRLSIEGPAASLVGFEALEQVGSLSLSDLRVPNLLSLGQLRQVEGGRSLGSGVPLPLPSAGLIDIDHCDELVDLSGLENLTAWGSLSIRGGAQLRSLAGLQAPIQLEQVELVDTPLLEDLSPLEPVREMAGFTLWRTGVQRMGSLLLDRAGDVVLSENPRLIDLDGLAELSWIQTLRVDDNDVLVRIDLPDLEDFETIAITGNAVLRVVPFYAANSRAERPPRSTFVTPSNPRLRRSLYEVGDNPWVTTIILPTDTYDIEQVAIYQNPALSTIDMGNLRQAESVWIIDNLALANITMAGLQSVEALVIKDNPTLSVAPFADVQTFSRDISGNLDGPSPGNAPKPSAGSGY